MEKRQNGPLFMVALILSILIIVLLVVFIGKKDLDEVQEMQDTISTSEEGVDDMQEALDQMNQEIQSGYDDLDEQLGE